jgi:pilus assembly protein CpaB
MSSEEVAVNKRFLSLVMFALVTSGMVSLLIYRMIVVRIAASSQVPTSKVLVAAHNLEIGTLIRYDDLKFADWAGPTPPQSISKKDDAVGRGVVSSIFEGEAVVESRLAPRGGGAGLAAIIPKGMRAVAVHVNEVVGVAGFVTPGLRVDVLVSANAPGRSDLGTQTRTVLQNIEVLSAGQNIQKDAEGKPITVPVVNLAVTPEQAEVLSLAGNDTKVQLILRNPLDTDPVKTPGITLAGLMGVAAAPPARPAPRPAPARIVVAEKSLPSPPPPPQTTVVEVLTGGKRSEVKFPEMPEAKP